MRGSAPWDIRQRFAWVSEVIVVRVPIGVTPMEKAYALQLKDRKFQNLYLCSFGYSQCHPRHSFGPAGRPNFIIHFVLEGKGVFETGDQRYALSGGQGFLIEPEDVIFYQADGAEPWTYIWIGFDGTDARQCIEDIGIHREQPTFQCQEGQQLKQLVLEMIHGETGEICNAYRLQSLLYGFFAVLMRDAVPIGHRSHLDENVYVNRALQYIRNNYRKRINVGQIAEAACVSRSYLYKLFQRSMGMSPLEFLIGFRLSRAGELLLMTEMSIESVALDSGFCDSRAFSKSFKRQYRVSPLKYRQMGWESQKERIRDWKDNSQDFPL